MGWSELGGELLLEAGLSVAHGVGHDFNDDKFIGTSLVVHNLIGDVVRPSHGWSRRGQDAPPPALSNYSPAALNTLATDGRTEYRVGFPSAPSHQ